MAFQDFTAAPVQVALAVFSQKAEYGINFNSINSEPAGDGVFNAPKALKAERLPQWTIIPFCTGGVGSKFSMRIWGWWNLGAPESVDVIWFPLLIAEFECVAGPFPRKVLPAPEFMCSSMTLIAGNIGQHGQLAQENGTPAFAMLDLPRPRKVQFDFRQGDVAPAFGNALFFVSSQP